MSGGAGRLLAAGALGALAALWTWTRPAPELTAGGDGPAVVIHVLDNGFHTDMALPRAALLSRPGPLAEAVRTLPPGAWIRVGWGDARFFVDQSPIHTRLPDGARAFLRPGNASVVMLDPEPNDPGLYAEDRVALALTPAAFDALAGRVESSLALEEGRARLVLARPEAGARFFASHETFSALKLCNHWTAEALNAGGTPIRPAAAVLSGQVMRAAELDSRAVRD